jgi:hypothetical protein
MTTVWCRDCRCCCCCCVYAVIFTVMLLSAATLGCCDVVVCCLFPGAIVCFFWCWSLSSRWDLHIAVCAVVCPPPHRIPLQIQRVVFTGNFLRRNRIAQQTVSYSLGKWSELSGGPHIEALFLRHEGYFGAVGAFLANHANAAGTP